MRKEYRLRDSDLVLEIAIRWGKLLLRHPPQKYTPFFLQTIKS
jgi:hypothetical protein